MSNSCQYTAYSIFQLISIDRIDTYLFSDKSKIQFETFKSDSIFIALFLLKLISHWKEDWLNYLLEVSLILGIESRAEDLEFLSVSANFNNESTTIKLSTTTTK